MWQETDMVTDQKASTFLQLSARKHNFRVFEDIVWIIDVLTEWRKSQDNFSHVPGDGSSWPLGIFGVSWTVWLHCEVVWAQGKAMEYIPWFLLAQDNYFLYGNIVGTGKVGKYPFTPCYCPRNPTNNELLDLESKKLCCQGRNFWPDSCGNSGTQFVGGNWSFWEEKLDQHLREIQENCPQSWLLFCSFFIGSSQQPCGGERTLIHPDFPRKTKINISH